MYLQEIKIVDLQTSSWDKTVSNKTTADYVFKEKRYINYRGDRAAAPPFKFVWGCYNQLDNFRDVREWKTRYKATEVTVDDPYWPEGITPTNGKYIEGDAILMKVPILEYARKRKAEIARSESRPEAIKRNFAAETKAMGLNLSDEELDRLLSSRT